MSLKYLVTFSVIIIFVFSGCLTRKQLIETKTENEIINWTDEKLCRNAYFNNNNIKNELLNRGLLTEEQYHYIKSDVHGNVLQEGMPKCAIWTFTNGGKIIEKYHSKGKVIEIWELHEGEFVFSKRLGGLFLVVTVEDNMVIDVQFPK